MATPQDEHGDGLLDDSGEWRQAFKMNSQVYWWHVATDAVAWDLEEGKAALASSP